MVWSRPCPVPGAHALTVGTATAQMESHESATGLAAVLVDARPAVLDSPDSPAGPGLDSVVDMVARQA
jgi:hypothetical protein